MTPLNALPTIIDGPGEYVARDGHRVTIHKVTPHDNPDTTSFSAKGSKWKMFRGKYTARGYDIWHISGRSEVLKESGRDIVAKYNSEEDHEIPPWN